MFCDYSGCTGYAFLHEEGASCDLCHRLQQPVFSSGADKDTEEEVLNHLLKWSLPFYQRLNFCKTNDDFFLRLIF